MSIQAVVQFEADVELRTPSILHACIISERSDGTSTGSSRIVSILRAVASNLRCRSVWVVMLESKVNHMSFLLTLVASLVLVWVADRGASISDGCTRSGKTIPT